jgi:hypothetical protein
MTVWCVIVKRRGYYWDQSSLAPSVLPLTGLTRWTFRQAVQTTVS